MVNLVKENIKKHCGQIMVSRPGFPQGTRRIVEFNSMCTLLVMSVKQQVTETDGKEVRNLLL